MKISTKAKALVSKFEIEVMKYAIEDKVGICKEKELSRSLLLDYIAELENKVEDKKCTEIK